MASTPPTPAAEVAVLASPAGLPAADDPAAVGAVVGALDGLEPELQAATTSPMAARVTMARDPILCTEILLQGNAPGRGVTDGQRGLFVMVRLVNASFAVELIDIAFS
jgi:hypothetical protein